MNKIFHRYFAFVMIVSAFAMGMQYSPEVNNYLSSSYVNVLDSMDDFILNPEVSISFKNINQMVKGSTDKDVPGRQTTEGNPVTFEVAKANYYAKPGDKGVTVMEVLLGRKELEVSQLKVKIGLASEGDVEKVVLYDPAGKSVVAEGKEVGKYWEFEGMKFFGERLNIKIDLQKNIFTGERMRPVLKINGHAPIYGNYLTIVGK